MVHLYIGLEKRRFRIDYIVVKFEKWPDFPALPEKILTGITDLEEVSKIVLDGKIECLGIENASVTQNPQDGGTLHFYDVRDKFFRAAKADENAEAFVYLFDATSRQWLVGYTDDLHAEFQPMFYI